MKVKNAFFHYTMTYPFKDYEFYGNRYVNVRDPTVDGGERMWYDRNIIENTPTECVICMEAEREMYTKYAHPKAYMEAHTLATNIAEHLASAQKNTEEYVEYYIFFYGREYRKIYIDLYIRYKQEYNRMVLERYYDHTQICQYHLESILYHYEHCSNY